MDHTWTQLDAVQALSTRYNLVITFAPSNNNVAAAATQHLQPHRQVTTMWLLLPHNTCSLTAK
jgi:hypothetical protein